MDTSTEKYNFPHSKSEKEEDILEQLCIWKTQNISLDLERICQHFRMEKRDIVVCLKRMQKEGYLEKLIAWKDKKLIKIVTGVRRCGKSMLLEIYQNYLTLMMH